MSKPQKSEVTPADVYYDPTKPACLKHGWGHWTKACPDYKSEASTERRKIHMAMLAKSENAKDLGDITVVPLGFAVAVALELIRQREAEAYERGIQDGHAAEFETQTRFKGE